MPHALQQQDARKNSRQTCSATPNQVEPVRLVDRVKQYFCVSEDNAHREIKCMLLWRNSNFHNNRINSSALQTYLILSWVHVFRRFRGKDFQNTAEISPAGFTAAAAAGVGCLENRKT
ncbi:hypothetical protein ABVT39_022483 [Epinephelus coioides]